MAGPLAVGAPSILRVWLGQFHPDSIRVLATLSAVAAFHSSSGTLSAIARGIGSPGLETRYTLLLGARARFRRRGRDLPSGSDGFAGLFRSRDCRPDPILRCCHGGGAEDPEAGALSSPGGPSLGGGDRGGGSRDCLRPRRLDPSPTFPLLLLQTVVFEAGFLGLCLALGALRWSEARSPFAFFRSSSPAPDQ